MSIASLHAVPLSELVRAYGCPGIVPLRRARAESPNQVPYLDLLSKHVRETVTLLPDAVAEFQGSPVMYFLDARAEEPAATARLELQQRLANRGDHAVLAVVRPGDLTLYPLNLDRAQLDAHGLGQTIAIADARAPFLFHGMATGSWKIGGQPEDADPVFKEIQGLLRRAVEDLVDKRKLDGTYVLSMTGRALFFRFLIDRHIVEPDDLEQVCPAALKGPKPHDLKAVFSTADRAAQTSAWLDETFNGDLLPLIPGASGSMSPMQRRKAYEKVYAEAAEQSGGLVFRHLEAILRGWQQMGTATQLALPIDWHDLNFCHIPIGVLSQVYEDFSHRVDPQGSRDQSVHYTPRALAKLLVEQALAGVDSPHEAHVLDPSCGAGVFLVLALRELVRLRWVHDGRRPSKSVIQSILHRQIRGFDISESALRLAALALYFTVIELNEITRPPSEHHAGKALQDLVLFDQKHHGLVLGSLGDEGEDHFRDYFDVVVGNPPWTRRGGDAKSQIDEVGTRIARRVLESRGLSELAAGYENPGGIPDVPFLWRAMEWAKRGGVIAFALEARLMLSHSGPATKARRAFLEAASLTGILNGSDLEKTAVWACHDHPWILLWARNEKPDLDQHEFQLLTPVRENDLADKGEFRLDFQSAYPVPVKKLIAHGWLFKSLAIGTSLDVQVMEKLVHAAQKQCVGQFWDRAGLVSGNGFSLKNGKNAPPDWLLRLPVFEPPTNQLPLTDEKDLPTFATKYPQRKLESARHRELYRHPILIIPETPGEDRRRPQAFRIQDRDVCFSKSFYGYSSAGSKHETLPVSLLSVLLHSTVFRFFCYLSSPRIGAGRRTIYKDDIDAFPFPVLESLSADERAKALALADALDAPGAKDYDAIDAFVGKLFGLTKADQQVVRDTVEFNGPYQKVREPAAQPPAQKEAETFARVLEKALQPFFKVAGQKVRAAVVPSIEGEWTQPWRFLTLLVDGDEWKPAPQLIADLMAEATKTSASRVVLPLPEAGLIMGLLNKRRYWTTSRARLCALHIACEHLDTSFPLSRRR